MLGSGHLGSALARALLERGYRVTVCGRRKAQPRSLAGLDLRYRSGDANTPGTVAGWIRGQQLVVDAATPYPLQIRNLWSGAGARSSQGSPISARGKSVPGRDHPTTLAVARTDEVIAATAQAGARLIFVSSFATLSSPSRERALLSRLDGQVANALYPYFEVKRQTEDRVLRAARDGLQVIVLNPATCFGPWDSKPLQLCLVPRLLDGELPFAVRRSISLVDVRDVAEAALSALELERYGRPMALVGHATTTEILIRRICQLGQGVSPPSFQVPGWLGRVGATGAGLATAAAPMATGSNVASGLLALALMHAGGSGDVRSLPPGQRPISLSKTLGDSIAWYRHLGY